MFSMLANKIPKILTADELIDKAFAHARKVIIPKRKFTRLERMRILTKKRLLTAQNELCNELERYVHAFPSFDALHPFYRNIIDLTIGLRKLKPALAAIQNCALRIRKIGNEYFNAVNRSRNISELGNTRRAAYGRLASIVNDIDNCLKFLAVARTAIMQLPDIDPNLPSIVVAGYPNVGKSTLVQKISTAKPQIAPYPFTTKGIIVGHFKHRNERIQIVDLPGLLDREHSLRNPIEKKAIAALNHLADGIIFLLDPTEISGPMAAQLRLLESIRKDFHAPVIVFENKADIMRTGSNIKKISALTGEGVEDLKHDILKLARHSNLTQKSL